MSVFAADRRGLGLLCVLVALSALAPGSVQADDQSHRQGAVKASERPGVQASDKIADSDDQHDNKNGGEPDFWTELEDSPLFVWFLVGGIFLFVLMWVEVGLAVICLMIKPLLDALPEEHRQLEMRRVWWLLLPPLMPFWNFYVFGRLSRSYASYHRSRGRTDSDGAVQLAHGYCIVVLFVLLFGWAGGQLPHTVATGLLVAYFVKLYGWRKEIRNAVNRRPGSGDDQADPVGVTSVASVSDPPPADPPPFPRRYDLDALRSGAMLLGIALHAAISFIGVGDGGWAVQDNDTSQAGVFGMGLWVIHGFRMQLFFVVSGFFTAMLWRRRGLKALLLHRAKRILVPCLVGVATIIPIINAVSILAAATVTTAQGDEEGQDEQQESDKTGEEGKDKPQEGEGKKDDVEGLGDILWLIYMVISYLPIFHHLWFLWYLCWLVAMFAIYAYVADRYQWRGPPRRLITSPLRYLWLLPVTMVPQACMGLLPGASEFGPDTAVGFIPAPHILLYYAVFFGFGVLYFDCDDQRGQLGRWWPVTLLVTFAVVLPLALDFSIGLFGWREQLAPASLYRPLNVLLQVLYSWGVTFGLIGAFRALLKRENKTIRYLSDSSYWLYVAHLPLVLLAQMAVRTWQIPVAAKFSLVCVVVTGILMLSYEYMVRYTLIGTMLNGKKTRPDKAPDEVSPSGQFE